MKPDCNYVSKCNLSKLTTTVHREHETDTAVEHRSNGKEKASFLSHFKAFLY